MSKKVTTKIVLGDNTLTVSGYYTAGREGVQYQNNGDHGTWNRYGDSPGDPPEPPEFEIETIMVGTEDITELMAGMFYEYRGVVTRDIKYTPVWVKIEELCIEAILEEER